MRYIGGPLDGQELDPDDPPRGRWVLIPQLVATGRVVTARRPDEIAVVIDAAGYPRQPNPPPIETHRYEQQTPGGDWVHVGVEAAPPQRCLSTHTANPYGPTRCGLLLGHEGRHVRWLDGDAEGASVTWSAV